MRQKVICYPCVYIVLEHHTSKTDAYIHGVYHNREEAIGKAFKVTHTKGKTKAGYVAVLKKPIQGKPICRY